MLRHNRENYVFLIHPQQQNGPNFSKENESHLAGRYHLRTTCSLSASRRFFVLLFLRAVSNLVINRNRMADQTAIHLHFRVNSA